MSAYLSLSQASREVGKSKSTISEYIRTGRLVARLNEKGIYEIDKADLFKAFNKNEQERTVDVEKSSIERHIELAIYKEKLEATKALLKNVEGERDYLREQLSSATDERRMLSNRLTLLESKPVEQHNTAERTPKVEHRGVKLWSLVAFSLTLLAFTIYKLYQLKQFEF
jgi:hypothetical protein